MAKYSNIRELRRSLDAKITREVIGTLDSGKYLGLAESCAEKLSGIIGSNYYLKGGNALSLLKPQDITGDWDFQLKPEKTVYRNWGNLFPEIDNDIIMILMDLGKSLILTKEIENVFKELSDSEIYSLTDPVYTHNQTNCFVIGHTYTLKTYSEILNDINYSCNPETGDGRIELISQEIKDLFPRQIAFSRENKVTPSVYVNYSIPGFLLYRLVIRYEYLLKNPLDYFESSQKNTVSLKSELIDISVPRPGSAEVYMAQEGIVSNFFGITTSPNKQIRIPGWGYHLFENLNLLQEIKLGISGSTHKKQKRMDRGTEAFREIELLNGERDIIKDLNPLIDSAQGRTASFINVYIRSLENTTMEEAITNINDRNLIKENLARLLGERTETSKVKGFQGLISLDFNWLGRFSVLEITNYLKGLLKISYSPANSVFGVSGVNVGTKQEEELKLMKTDPRFKVVSPLLDLNQVDDFPLPFVLLVISDQQLFDSLRVNRNFRDIAINGLSGNIKIMRLIVKPVNNSSSITPLYVRYIFVSSRRTINYNITDYLENSIFVSQRSALARAYQKTSDFLC